MLGIGGPHARIRLAFRYDLPDPPDDGLAADIAAHAATVLRRQHLTMAIAVGYGLGRTVTPVVDVVATALREAGIAVQDVLRVEGGRYWSYLCGDPACCPPDGVPFDSVRPSGVGRAGRRRPARCALTGPRWPGRSRQPPRPLSRCARRSSGPGGRRAS